MPFTLAFMTVGSLREPLGHEQVRLWTGSWGEVNCLRAIRSMPNERIVSRLSLWADLESVAAFSYHGSWRGADEAKGMVR